jgi:hypothetical protein
MVASSNKIYIMSLDATIAELFIPDIEKEVEEE